MLSPTELSTSQKRDHKKNIKRNIKETQINLFQIKKKFDQNILPFSLQHRKNQCSYNNRWNHQKQKQILCNGQQSIQQQRFSTKFDSRNTKLNDTYQQTHSFPTNENKYKWNDFHYEQAVQLKKQENQAFQRNRQDIKKQEKNKQERYKQESKNISHSRTQNQQNLQAVSNQDHQNIEEEVDTIQLQIHLTIAKQKYTLKVSNHHENADLTEIVERFLIQNQISNPSKKSYNKTKLSIIQMVHKKILERSKQNFQPIKNFPNQKQINKYLLKQKIIQRNPSNFQKTKVQNFSNNIEYEHKSQFQQLQGIKNQQKRCNHRAKYQKPIFKQKSKISINSYDQKSEEQACSPSFKSSQYIQRSPINRPSSFSPQPKHKENKYQTLIANYYNDKINQNIETQERRLSNQKTQYSRKQPNIYIQQQSSNQIPNKYIQAIKNQSIIEENQQKNAKSVYQKWKQRQKQKDTNRVNDRSFDNALKQKKQNLNVNSKNIDNYKQRSIENYRQKGWNNKLNKTTSDLQDRTNKSVSKLNTNANDEVFNKKKIKQNYQSQKRINNHKNLNLSNKSYCRDNILNRSNDHSIISPLKNGNTNKSSNIKPTYSPYHKNQGYQTQKQSDQSPLKSINQTVKKNTKDSNIKNHLNIKNHTHYHEDDPAQQSLIYQMAPDHFYKQGIIFQAKKQIQIQQKFKQIYPFTTRMTQDGKKSRQKSISTSKNNLISRQKYFSSKLSTNKSLSNIGKFQQKQKSALHEKLFRDAKQKNKKKIQFQVSKRIYTIAKNPRSEDQINLMKQNLKNIKGLSRQKQIKLIEKNIKIKQKIRQKQRIIDQQLQQMIKEGKVQQACHIGRIQKSPFRKTKVF